MERIEEREIRRRLAGPFGGELAVYDAVGSTNDAAKLLAKNGAPHGAAVVARRQTAGRGRLGRPFFSPEGAGVYLTVILRPRPEDGDPMLLTAAAAVAAARGIQAACGVRVRIKWVNDLYWEGKKLCGILAESALRPDGAPEYVVVGIGVNLTGGGFPPELGEIATSLDAAGAECGPNRLIAEILNAFGEVYGRLGSGDFLEEYRARSCVLGKRVRVLGGGEPFDALAVAIDGRARLLVERPDGGRETLSSGELSIRGDWR